MNIALFDLDNTLIKGDSDHEWGNFLVENNYVDKKSYKIKNDYFFEQYKKGVLCPKEFAKFSYEPLTKYDYENLLMMRKNFFKEKIKPLVRVLEVLLLAILVTHITNTIILTIKAKKASNISKEEAGSKHSSFSSRTMFFSGSILFIFIVTHLSTFWYNFQITDDHNSYYRICLLYTSDAADE